MADWKDPSATTKRYDDFERRLQYLGDAQNEFHSIALLLQEQIPKLRWEVPPEFLTEAEHLLKCAALLDIHKNPRKKFLVARKKDGNHKIIEIDAECEMREDAEKVVSILSSMDQVVVLRDDYRKSKDKVCGTVKDHLDKYGRTEVPPRGIDKFFASHAPGWLVEKIFYREAHFKNASGVRDQENIVARVVSAAKQCVEIDCYAFTGNAIFDRRYQKVLWFPERNALRLSRHWPDHRFECLFDSMPIVDSRFEESTVAPDDLLVDGAVASGRL